MKEQFIIISSKCRRPVSSICKERIERILGATNIKPTIPNVRYLLNMLPARETVK